ncbi:MAG: cobalamin B12-binding domain-containing protein [Candidatus Omnitrophica bacterium]|nr:cobalamin B12-binding domain-containing protein [Candidatus Omnitrophota bacterium]
MSTRNRQARSKIRVLLAKAGLDGHDRGAKVIARALRDAGMEVIYTGLRQSVNTIVRSAVQEDVDVVAVSILSGAHMSVLPKIQQGLKKFGKQDVLITGGGIIPPQDQARLQKMGIGKMFGPGESISEIVRYISDSVCPIVFRGSAI